MILAASFMGCAKNLGSEKALPHQVSISNPAFQQTMGSVIVPGFVGGNRIQTLENGNEIFPAMLAAIRGAKKSINFETFIYSKGKIPEAFTEALAERARAGVRVNVIVDAVGSSKSRSYRKELIKAGANVEPFHTVFWFDPRRFNHRTHRKLLIVDGKIGFIGGVGIADYWNGNASTPEEWRDTHYRVEGPVVAQLQGAFQSNWFDTREEILQGSDYFPGLASRGTMQARVFNSSPRQNRSSVVLSYQLAIASARHTLLIQSPYFIPDDALIDSICAAARRGVKVQITMPNEHIDMGSVRRASRQRWSKLLEAGVELYEYQPTMIHSKLLIADGLFVSVGSANFDFRSLLINDESNMNVLDAAFAAEQTRLFQSDLKRTKRMKGDWKKEHILELPLHLLEKPFEPLL